MVEIFEEKASKGVPFNKIATIQNATTLVRNERLQKSLSKTGNLFGNTSYYSIVGRGFLSTLPLHEDSHRPPQHPPPSLYCLLPFFTYSWYHGYGSTLVEPWYLSIRRTLLCVLCQNASLYCGLTHNVLFS